MEIVIFAMIRFIVLLVATSAVVTGHHRSGHHHSRSRHLVRQSPCRTDVYKIDSQNSCVKAYEIFPIEIKVLKDDEELDEREMRHLIKKEIRSLQRLLNAFDPIPPSYSLLDDLIELCCSYKRPELSSKYAQNKYDAETDDDQGATEDEEDESETYNEAEINTNYAPAKPTELPSTNSTSAPIDILLSKQEYVEEEKIQTTQIDSDTTDTQTLWTQKTTSEPTENLWATKLVPAKDKTHQSLTTQVDDAVDSSTDESQYEGIPPNQTESDAMSRRPKKHKRPQTTQVDDIDTTRHPPVPWFFPDSDSQYGDEVLDKTNQMTYDRTYSKQTKHQKKKHHRDAKRQKMPIRIRNAKKHTSH